MSLTWWVALVLAGLALALSGYLTYESATGDGLPPGCGDDAGCGAVLSTKWSAFFGIPVSYLAVGLYTTLFATLLIRKRLGGPGLAGIGALIIGAGLWFSYVQIVEIQAICWYCMADHALGFLLGCVLLSHSMAWDRWGGIIVGVFLTAALAIGQTVGPDRVGPIVDGGASQEGQSLTVLNGLLTLNLSEEIILPGPDQSSSQQALLIKMFDYHCPHCHAADRMIHELGNVALVLLPTPLNTGCNDHIHSTNDRFAESCEVSRLALAVKRAAPQRFAEFHRMMNGEGWPHSLEQARGFAEALVDPAQLQAQLSDPALDAVIQRNTQAWGAAKSADLVGGLPVFIAPNGALTYGRISDGRGLLRLLHTSPFAPLSPKAQP